jgi:hypothetical protein
MATKTSKMDYMGFARLAGSIAVGLTIYMLVNKYVLSKYM